MAIHFIGADDTVKFILSPLIFDQVLGQAWIHKAE